MSDSSSSIPTSIICGIIFFSSGFIIRNLAIEQADVDMANILIHAPLGLLIISICRDKYDGV